MKTTPLCGLLFVMFFSLAAHVALAADSSAYTIKVHVSKSELRTVCETIDEGSACWLHQFLTVTIDAKRYELESERPRPQLLSTGDYQARLIKDEKTSAAEYRREYEFIFSDGKALKYAVVGESE